MESGQDHVGYQVGQLPADGGRVWTFEATAGQ